MATPFLCTTMGVQQIPVQRLPDFRRLAICSRRICISRGSDSRPARASRRISKSKASWSGVTNTSGRNQQQSSQLEQEKRGNCFPVRMELPAGVYVKSCSISRKFPSSTYVGRGCSRNAFKIRIFGKPWPSVGRSSRSKFMRGLKEKSSRPPDILAGCCCMNGFSVGKARSPRQRRKSFANGIENLQFFHDVAEASDEIHDRPLSESNSSTNGHSSKTLVKSSGWTKYWELRPVPRVSRFTTRIQQNRSLQHICRCSSDDHNEAKLADTVADDESVDNIGVQMALALLRFYKWEISPYIPASCRYVPTCSEYAQQAYKKYGFAKGSILTAWRLARCNPLGSSGFDPPRWFGEEKPPQV